MNLNARTHIANKGAVIPSPIPSCLTATRNFLVGTDAARNLINHVRLQVPDLCPGIETWASNLGEVSADTGREASYTAPWTQSPMAQGVSGRAGRQEPFSNPTASNPAIFVPRVQNLVDGSLLREIHAGVELRTSLT